MIQMQRSICSGVLHPHHSIFKQTELFCSDSQALEASTCPYTPFCSALTVVMPTLETQPRAQDVLLKWL